MTKLYPLVSVFDLTGEEGVQSKIIKVNMSHDIFSEAANRFLSLKHEAIKSAISFKS